MFGSTYPLTDETDRSAKVILDKDDGTDLPR